MASRYEQRSVVIQTLFEADFRGSLTSEGMLPILLRNCEEYLETNSIPEFSESVTLGVVLKKDVLDEIIEKAAPEWPIEKIAIIDRALLRLGLFELLYGETYNIPHKVAINEAIELSKAFGGDSSRRFVNGVLGAIYREMHGEDPQKPKQKKVEVINLAGALVFRKTDEGNEIALVYDMFKYWTLPKGKREGEESIEECAKREVREETGVEIDLISKIQENEYTAGSDDDTLKRKHVTYFLAEHRSGELRVEEGHTGILKVQWFKVENVMQQKLYRDMKPIIEMGIKMIS
jgi:N utilization substance protein B